MTMKTPEEYRDIAFENCIAGDCITGVEEAPCRECTINIIAQAISDTREECAKIADGSGHFVPSPYGSVWVADHSSEIAKKIRQLKAPREEN